MTGLRIADFGVRVGRMEPGREDRITDVPGVRVGHATVRDGRHRTGITLILPCEDNPFSKKLVAACHVQNGFGKSCGLVQIEELGELETPVALTNTLNVGLAADALVSLTARRCGAEGIPVRSVNPVVGETNDSRLNDILDRTIGLEQVLQAEETAGVRFEEGDVGAGAGTVCHGLKGGIGSASRIVTAAGVSYTVGVLVQSNHGCLEELRMDGRPVGREILEAKRKAAEHPAETVQEEDRGSVMVVLATDLPVDSRQLKRILKRCAAGLARCGSYFGHGSGDVFLGFSTANRIPSGSMDAVREVRVLTEHTLERAFLAAAEATEEAVLNSLAAASPAVAADGTRYDSLADWLRRLA